MELLFAPLARPLIQFESFCPDGETHLIVEVWLVIKILCFSRSLTCVRCRAISSFQCGAMVSKAPTSCCIRAVTAAWVCPRSCTPWWKTNSAIGPHCEHLFSPCTRTACVIVVVCLRCLGQVFMNQLCAAVLCANSECWRASVPTVWLLSLSPFTRSLAEKGACCRPSVVLGVHTVPVTVSAACPRTEVMSVMEFHW